MDSNNFVGNCGVGEREARVASDVVARRHWRMAHGIGRSGDVAAVQPKAAGSSLMVKMCTYLVLDALRMAGLKEFQACVVVPCATGLTLALTLLAVQQRAAAADAAAAAPPPPPVLAPAAPADDAAPLPPAVAAAVAAAAAAAARAVPLRRYVVWSRIDQKSCLKAIATAGFVPVVVELTRTGDELRADAAAVAAAIDALPGGAAAVLAVVTTTSCFAPRAPDAVDQIAKLCAAKGVAHVINNAYGVQCAAQCKLLGRAMRVGRVDAVVQSTDKNFLVPVGGAVVAGPDPAVIAAVGKAYPGRASASPVADLLVTLLGLGASGWRGLLADREAAVDGFRDRLAALAAAHGERLLVSPLNRISFAMTLSLGRLGGGEGEGGAATWKEVSFLGSMLFTRCVSGTRVVVPDGGTAKEVAGIAFRNYGAHTDAYPSAYLTAACAIGQTPAEVDAFFGRLDKALGDHRGKVEKQRARR